MRAIRNQTQRAGSIWALTARHTGSHHAWHSATPRLTFSAKTLLSIAVCVLSACGGGTTGTSSSDSLRFSGYAQGADGIRAAQLSMSVISATTNENLVDSGTNDAGEFEMELPPTESAFEINVTGVGTTTISRQQRGVGSMASKLSATSSGTLIAEDVFEVQAISPALCSTVTVSGNSLVVSSDTSTSPCPVQFAVASSSLPLASFRANLEANCGGAQQIINSVGASPQGVLTVDLSQAFARSCSDIVVGISSTRATGLGVEFPVL